MGTIWNKSKNILSGLIAVSVILCTIFHGVIVHAEKISRVKVGFYKLDGYHEMDEKGRKSGYGFDFLSLTSRYANLNYEFVGYDKTWEETLQMLERGEIDLVTSAQKTKEGMKKFEFSVPIGSNMICINVLATNERFKPDDFETFKGMTIGLLAGSSSNEKVMQYAKDNDFTFKAKYYSSADELSKALQNGEVDAIAASNLRRIKDEKTISEFGREQFYAIARKGDTKLIEKINYAIEQMNTSEGNWKDTLFHDNYELENYVSLSFTEEEKAFIEEYSRTGKKLIFAVDNSWAPFSWKEGDEYYGIIPEYCKHLMEMCGINYEFYIRDEEITNADVLSDKIPQAYFCYTLKGEETEAKGLIASPEILKVGTCYVMRKDIKEIKCVGLCDSTPMLNSMLEFDSQVRIKKFRNTNEAVEAVRKGTIDAVCVYNYDGERVLNNDISRVLIIKPIPGYTLSIRAVCLEETDHILMSILSKCISRVDPTELDTIVSRSISYSVADITWKDLIAIYPIAFSMMCMIGTLLILFVIITLYRKNLQAKMNAEKAEFYNIIKGLSSEYYALWHINSENLMMRFLRSADKETEKLVEVLEKQVVNYDKAIEEYIENYVCEEDRERVREAVCAETVIEKVKEDSIYTINYLKRNEKSETSYHQMTYARIPTESERVDFALGFRDVDDQVKEEIRQRQILKDALAQAEERDSIIVNAGYGVWHIIQEDGKLPRMKATPKMLEILGVTEHSLTEEEIYDFWYSRILESEMPSVEASIQEMVHNKFSENTYRWLHPMKGVRYVRCGGRAQFLSEHKQELSGYHSDVTEIVMYEEENKRMLAEAKVLAEQANDAKTAFLFNMSHDIRTPMNAILGFTDLMDKYQEDAERRQDYIRKIKESGEVLLSILNNVLEMARIEKGTVIVDEQAWSMEQFCDTLLSVFQEQMTQKGIEFTMTNNIKNKYVFCDPTKLQEVFLNIISNAYKYTNKGGKVTMDLEEISSDREGYTLYKTTVSDTGIGMSETFLPRLFEEFSREKNSERNSIEGTGLGMPIVKRLVELMGGTINVESKKGIGTRFTVVIPHKIAKKEDIVDHSISEIAEDSFVGKRILIAEDNDLNAEIAMEILREAGFYVERAEDGQECVKMVKLNKAFYYDLILMDIQMPELNGYEATRIIRAMDELEKASIPIIAITANAFEEDKKEAYAAGMNAHLGKPIVVRDLMRTLAEVLN